MPVIHNKLKKSTYYRKGRLKSGHVKKFKQHKSPRKCKCFICGNEGCYAYQCKIDIVRKQSLNMYQKLELTDEIDIVSVDSNDNEQDSDIYSIYGGEEAHNFVEVENLIDFEDAYGHIE